MHEVPTIGAIPILVSLLIVLCLEDGSLSIAGEARPDATAIVKRAIEAHGGKAKLSGLQKTYTKLSGHLLDADMVIEVWSLLPRCKKMIIRVDKNGQKARAVRVINDGICWEKVNDAETTIRKTKEEVAEQEENFYRSYVLLLFPLVEEAGRFELRYQTDAHVNGRAAQHVIVSSKGQADLSLYFDKESGLLNKLAGKTVIRPATGAITATYFEDYKDFSGLKFPQRTKNVLDGKLFSEHRLVDLQILSDFPEGTFSHPK